MKILAALLLIAALPACTVALHGRQSSGGGATTTTVSSSGSASASGSNYAVRAFFGRPVPPGAPGGHLSVSTGGAAVAVLVGIVVVNAIDYLSSGPLADASANRPILHTCSCYGYRPDQDPQPPRE